MLSASVEPWYNQNWVVAAATLLGAIVLWRQLRALNQKNEFDVLQFVAEKMQGRFGPASNARDRFYSLKDRVRDLVGNLPENVRRCRGNANYLSCLVSRMALVRELPENIRQADFDAIRHFVNTVNDVAEMVEEGLVDVGIFLGKYHLALTREVYIAEPYIYYFNLYGHSGRWGMRVLRVGEMARRFNDINPIHRKPVFYGDDLSFSCIYGAPSGRLLWARQLIWFIRNRLALYPKLTSRSKRQQNRFLERVRRELQARG